MKWKDMQRCKYSLSPLALAIVLLISTFSLSAKTLWLDSSASYKNTQCSFQAPCRRLGLAADLANPGDEIVLKDGRYEFGHVDSVTGSTDAPIVIRAQHPHHAIFQRAFEGPRDLLEVSHSQHLIIRDISFNGAARASIRINNSQFVDIINNRMHNSGVWGVFTNHSNDLVIESNHIIGPARQHGIYLSNSGDRARINGNIIEGALGCGIQLNGDLRFGGGLFAKGDGIISDVSINDNRIVNVGSKGGAAINLDGAQRIIISNNVIKRAYAAGIASFKIDGAIASREINIVDNNIQMAPRSRSAIVVMQNEGLVSVSGNSISVLDPDAKVIDVSSANYQAKKGWRRYWQNWFGQPALNQLDIGNNDYQFAGDFARVNQINVSSPSQLQ